MEKTDAHINGRIFIFNHDVVKYISIKVHFYYFDINYTHI